MDGKLVNIIASEQFVGEDGKDYIRQTLEILTPRRTYIKGAISGKYRGDRLGFEGEQPNLAFFDFEIYEAQVVCESRENFRKDRPFRLKDKIAFPREKLPKDIPVTLEANGVSYDVNILEPALYDFQSPRRYRQVHGDEVYGNFSALITGYIFDYERRQEEVILEYVEDEPVVIKVDELPPQPVSPVLPVVSGPVTRKGDYVQSGFSDGTSQWRLDRSKITQTDTGCLGGIFSLIGLILGIFFLIVLIPNLFWVILIGAFLYLIFYLAPVLKWIFRALAFCLLFLFGFGIVNMFLHGIGRSSGGVKSTSDGREIVESVVPKPPLPVRTGDSSEEIYDPSDADPGQNQVEWIKRFRSWDDYDGKHYEGYYQIKKSAFDRANYYKTNLRLPANTSRSYDQMVYSLKEHDRGELGGLYKMLDSIRETNQLSERKFAEMAVSMVQDIPYCLVLEQECNANRYHDAFISDWLSKHDGFCDPYQRFGINSPVEFLTNLKGDCDTRTLLLYSIFSYYGYDVVLLSSEIYKHSIIGINLPVDGKAFYHKNQRYVVWETTAPGARPGMLSPDVANMNYWRISLKSK